MFNIVEINGLNIWIEWTSMILRSLDDSGRSSNILINLKYLLKKYKEAHPSIIKIKIDQRFFVNSDVLEDNATKIIISGASKDNVTEILQAGRTDNIKKIYIATNDQTTYNEALPIYNGWWWDKTKTHLENWLWAGRLNDNDNKVSLWGSISVDRDGTPKSYSFRDESGSNSYLLVYGNRAKMSLIYENSSVVVMWEKNNAMELPEDTLDISNTYVSFPWEWSKPLTDWNNSSYDKEMREGIPVALYTLKLAQHPKVLHKTCQLSDTEIEDENSICYEYSYPSGTREADWEYMRMKSTEWMIMLSYPYSCIDTATGATVNSMGLSWLAKKGVTHVSIKPKYVDIELNRIEIGEYENDQAELQIPRQVTEIITWTINNWDNIDVYETTHNWVPLLSENKLNTSSRLLNDKPYIVRAKDKEWYVVKGMKITKNGGDVVASSLSWECEFTPSLALGDYYTVNVNYEKVVVKKNISNTSEAKLPKNIVTYKWNTPLKIQEISKADYDKLTSVSQGVLYITKDGGGEPLLPHVKDPTHCEAEDDELLGD